MSSLTPEAYAVVEGRHSDPFRYLGPHVENDSSVVRVFLPDAEGVAIVDEQGRESELQRIHDAGLFEGRLANGPRQYRLRAPYGERQVEIEDPYRFPPILSDLDLYLLGEGTHMHLYEKLGAHPMVLVNNSLIQPRGLSARHCRPFPFPGVADPHRPRREGGASSLEISAARWPSAAHLLITLSVYCCVSHQDRVPVDRRPALFGASFVARHGTE